MNEDFLAQSLAAASFAALYSAGPPLLVAAVVGFVTALFQGVTQIQDQSLPLTLKILAIAAAYILFGAALARPVVTLADQMLRAFPVATM